MDLSNRKFELLENKDGLASSKTKMVFNKNSDPWEATFSGPNVFNGHVLVSKSGKQIDMIYHAQTPSGELVAGKAIVQLTKAEKNRFKMQLNWQWLTGDRSSGVSVWADKTSERTLSKQ